MQPSWPPCTVIVLQLLIPRDGTVGPIFTRRIICVNLQKHRLTTSWGKILRGSLSKHFEAESKHTDVRTNYNYSEPTLAGNAGLVGSLKRYRCRDRQDHHVLCSSANVSNSPATSSSLET